MIWKKIEDGTYYMTVHGGVVVRVTGCAESANGISATDSLCFVPLTVFGVDEWKRKYDTVTDEAK